MKRLSKLFLLLCVAMGFCACSNDDSVEFDYLPVKLVGSQRWSIMDVKTGEVVFKDEFKNKPSAVYNDVFLVQNDNGTYDYFNIKDVKTPINKDSYYMAADFVGSDITPATKPGECISLINTKGEVVVVLDKAITACSSFNDGLASYKDASEKEGFINTKGEIVIKAQYDGVGRFSDDVVICRKEDKKNDLTTYYVIDKEGKELFSFNSKEYSKCGVFSDGLLPVVKGDEVIYLNKEGKKVYTLCNVPESAIYKVYLCGYKDERSIFCEGSQLGLKDKDNNIILRAKYDLMYYIGQGRYIAEVDNKYGIIDKGDKTLLEFKYDDITKLNSNVFLVKSDETYTLIDSEGKDLTNYNFSHYSLATNHYVKSNYIDTKEYAQQILDCFTDQTCRGYSAENTLKDFENDLTYSASYYSDECTLLVDGNDGVEQQCLVAFDGNISSRTYKYENYYYFSYKVPSGYQFNYSMNVSTLVTSFDLTEYEVVEDKIVDEVENVLKSKGYEQQGDNYWESPNGCFVGLAYKDGIISLWYYFGNNRRVELNRQARKNKSKKTPEGMPVDESASEEVCDSIAVDDFYEVVDTVVAE